MSHRQSRVGGAEQSRGFVRVMIRAEARHHDREELKRGFVVVRGAEASLRGREDALHVAAKRACMGRSQAYMYWLPRRGGPGVE